MYYRKDDGFEYILYQNSTQSYPMHTHARHIVLGYILEGAVQSLSFFHSSVNGFFRILWYQPHIPRFWNTRYAVFAAKYLYTPFWNAPFFCCLWRRHIFHKFFRPFCKRYWYMIIRGQPNNIKLLFMKTRVFIDGSEGTTGLRINERFPNRDNIELLHISSEERKKNKYWKELKKWIRLDARGNKTGVNAQFSVETEQLAFQVRPKMGETDSFIIYPDPDRKILEKMRKNKTRTELWDDLPTELEYNR